MLTLSQFHNNLMVVSPHQARSRTHSGSDMLSHIQQSPARPLLKPNPLSSFVLLGLLQPLIPVIVVASLQCQLSTLICYCCSIPPMSTLELNPSSPIKRSKETRKQPQGIQIWSSEASVLLWKLKSRVSQKTNFGSY